MHLLPLLTMLLIMLLLLKGHSLRLHLPLLIIVLLLLLLLPFDAAAIYSDVVAAEFAVPGICCCPITLLVLDSKALKSAATDGANSPRL